MSPSPLHQTKDRVPIRGGGQLFACGAEETPEATILRPSGEVDLATISAFRDALAQAAAQGRSIIVDMSGIGYIDSTGIHALVDQAACAKESGDLVVLAAPTPTVRRVMDIVNLNAAIPVLASVEVALDLLRSRAKLSTQPA